MKLLDILALSDDGSSFFQNRDESGKRDYLYYLAIGNARIKEYQTALKYVRALLQVQPGNRQAQGGNSMDNFDLDFISELAPR